MPSFFVALFLGFWLSAVDVIAETHTILFDNQCGHGTPRLIQNGNILSNGEPFTSNGPFSSGIAYLQTGNCLLNGEGCTLVEMTLGNPTCPGCGSSTDISLIPPHAYSVPVSFSYSGGCNGQGATCASANCKTAFFVPDDNQVQVQCQENNVNLVITFCPGSTGGASNVSKSPSTTAVVHPTVTRASTSSTGSTTPVPTHAPNAPQCSRNRLSRRRSLDFSSELARSPRMVHEHRRRLHLKF
ncbi:hypothetical protein GALMADRAFT_248877 [Galerina marginata CBS 339.88]|uniref:Glycopeptide n=1 Tax=Galerina marginata (strain CBS 339.88) TaxID=685588 RepID=A0A067SYA9_GALM3|nr:hypothetical protein GALMADRAFT_248877 [Galerina marginata CBS 339.88]